MVDITNIENTLWEAADDLRANSKLTSTEYSMPVLGIIFLKHAHNRFQLVKNEIEGTLPKRNGKTREITKEDFTRKNAIFLPEKSRYDYLVNLPDAEDKATAVIKAMELIEDEYTDLQGILPKDYHIFENDLLSRLIKVFNNPLLDKLDGDIFGRIYEYFIMKFALQGAQDNGEFFTPVSLVQLIVNIIEPKSGIILDPACGSGGMFVQTSHFHSANGINTNENITFFGQEKTATTIKLAKMNLAVHGLEGKINEANTFYEDVHSLIGKADYVMANPPFNVDKVDSEKVKTDKRLQLGLPGINKNKEFSNANYLWISYFHSYLKENGRAGFVMSAQASSSGGQEKEVRKNLIETNDVEVMISIRNNFFYTRSVPCELWFYNKRKPEHLKDKVLMIDARNIYRKVTRKINDFNPEHLNNITAIVWLFREEYDKYNGLIINYIKAIKDRVEQVDKKIEQFNVSLNNIKEKILTASVQIGNLLSIEDLGIDKMFDEYLLYSDEVRKLNEVLKSKFINLKVNDIKDQNELINEFMIGEVHVSNLLQRIESIYKLLINLEGNISSINKDELKMCVFNIKEFSKEIKGFDEERIEFVNFLKDVEYHIFNLKWLHTKFPDRKLQSIEGLVKVVSKKEISEKDWSLTPGQYVGISKEEQCDEDLSSADLERLNEELLNLHEEANQLMEIIDKNLKELI